MAGLGAAHRLHADGITPVMYDKNSYHRPHRVVSQRQRFHVRPRPPYLVLKDPRMQDLLADSVDQRYEP